jgi:hypothetical protein
MHSFLYSSFTVPCTVLPAIYGIMYGIFICPVVEVDPSKEELSYGLLESSESETSSSKGRRQLWIFYYFKSKSSEILIPCFRLYGLANV